MALRRKQRRLRSRLKKEFEESLQSGVSMLSPERSALLLEKLHKKIAGKEAAPPRRTILIYAKWAAAAMILLMAGAAWRHYNNGHKAAPVVTSAMVKEDQEIVEFNNSDSVRHLVLSDHSTITLSQGSSISYHASFDTGRREVNLSGKAIFEVTKDAARPFTVRAGEISTTVLGTRFLMNTLQQNKVSVKLFEGKVVIRATAMKDVYLSAGEQFVMDNRSKHFTVKPFKENKDTISGKETDTTGISLEFNQEPLGKVLASIGKQYNVQFNFSGESFNNMLVTGKLLPSDSLDVVLSMLGNINGLSFKKISNNKIAVARIQ